MQCYVYIYRTKIKVICLNMSGNVFSLQSEQWEHDSGE